MHRIGFLLLSNQLLEFPDERAQAVLDPLFEKVGVIGIQPKRGKRLTRINKIPAGAKEAKVERLPRIPQALSFRQEAIDEARTERISVHVKRIMKVGNVCPEVIAILRTERVAIGSKRGLPEIAGELLRREALPRSMHHPFKIRKTGLTNKGAHQIVDLARKKRREFFSFPLFAKPLPKRFKQDRLAEHGCRLGKSSRRMDHERPLRFTGEHPVH